MSQDQQMPKSYAYLRLNSPLPKLLLFLFHFSGPGIANSPVRVSLS